MRGYRRSRAEPGGRSGSPAAGGDARGYADLATLARAVEAGEPAPDVIVARTRDRGAGDPVGMVQPLTESLQALVRQWLVLERLPAARLAIVTAGAVAARPGNSRADLANAAVWGLIRSVQQKSPGRLMLADLSPAGATDEDGSTRGGGAGVGRA